MMRAALRTSRALLLAAPALALPLSCSLVVDTEELQAGASGLDCGPDTKVCPDRLAMDFGTCVSKTLAVYGCGAKECAPCVFPNAEARCDNKTKLCARGPCLEPYEDCDGNETNGCEADLGRDEHNCGGCANRCGAENGVTVCSEGQCLIFYCSKPFADCDDRYSNGCETDLRTSLQHCGACGKPCAGSCEDGSCIL